MLRIIKKAIDMPLDELWAKFRIRVEIPILRFLSDKGAIGTYSNQFKRQMRFKKFSRNDASATINEKNLDYFKNRTDFIFFCFSDSKKEIIDRLNQHKPNWGKKAVQEAEKICAHKFSFFDVEQYDFDEEIDWHLDFKTGNRWPMKFYSDIHFRGHNNIGDVKYSWELSRHQYFICLGKAYWYTGDEKYTDEFMSQVLSWTKANPLYRGIHWTSSMEPAIRIISWIWAFYFFKESPKIRISFLEVFINAIWEQLNFISKNLTLGQYANNHLIGEACGLFVGSLFLKKFKKTSKWIETSRKILIDEMLKQTQRDGGNVEQASSYQRFTMDFFILFKILHEQNFGQLSIEADQRLEKMFEFVMALICPNGEMPVYGDSDNARGLVLSSLYDDDYRPLVGIGATLYKRKDMKWVSKEIDEGIIFLTGLEGYRSYENIEATKPGFSSILLPHSGYCVMRDGWDKDSNYLLFDCGPMGYKSGGHGHADALSFQLMSKGGDLLVDPGTYAYNQEPDFRDYFRGTRSHNTVTVNNKDQADINDRMSWKRMPHTTVKDHYFSEYFDMIWAETDGYERLDSSVTHTRRVIASKNPVYYLVIDDMSPQKKNIKNKYHLNFHVSPGSTFVEGDFLTVLIEKERNMLMGVNGTRDVNLKTYFGGIEPVGWFSRMYGQKIESNTFSYQIFTDGDAGYCSFIIPYNKSAPVLDGFLADRKNGSVYISLTINGVKYTWIVNQDIKETQFNNIQFIGKIALICQDRDSQLKYVYSMSAQMLHFSEQLIFTNEIPKSGLIVPPSIGD